MISDVIVLSILQYTVKVKVKFALDRVSEARKKNAKDILYEERFFVFTVSLVLHSSMQPISHSTAAPQGSRDNTKKK